LTTFVDTDQRDNYYNLLNERVQAQTESVQSYYWDVKRLLDKANEEMSVRDQLNYLTKGLRNEFKKVILRKNPTTLEDAFKVLKEEERYLRKIQNPPERKEELKKKILELENKIQVVESKPITSTTRDHTGKSDSEERPNRLPFKRDYRTFSRGAKDRFSGRNKSWKTNQGRKEFPSGKRYSGAFRTVEGVPICRICRKVGHREAVCWYRDGQKLPRRYQKEEKIEPPKSVKQIQENKPDKNYSCLFAKVMIGSNELVALFDTGANISLINRQYLEENFNTNEIEKKEVEQSQGVTADGSSLPFLYLVRLELTLLTITTRQWFRVAENIPSILIIGMDILEAIKADIFIHKRQIVIDGRVVLQASEVEKPSQGLARAAEQVILPPHTMASIPIEIQTDIPLKKTAYLEPRVLRNGIYSTQGILKIGEKNNILVYNPSRFSAVVYHHQMISRISSIPTITQITTQVLSEEDIRRQIDSLEFATDLTTEEGQRFKTLLMEYIDLFARNPKKPDSTLKVRHYIDTEKARPLSQRPYRISPKEKEVIQKEVDEMEANKIIQKSKSPWASPVVLVPKPDGSIRFCIDYRKLNKITKKDVYPLPRIDEILDSMIGMTFFSTFDLASGYWQVLMDEDSREKTAFITHNGLYEFLVMPFGLCNAPATFQRMMDEVIKEAGTGRGYIDDVIIGTRTFQEHLDAVARLFKVFRKHKL
ncbi:MAG: reverse transcriptase family protein, partial [Propionibacteriaceae bacterium]|nr:reverse transcriptase family protein [Propionibacteriaceae bacterium]